MHLLVLLRLYPIYMYIIHRKQEKSRRKVKKVKVHIEFDERRILAAVQRGSINALRRAGTYAHQAARNRVAQSAAASAPGSPPNTRRCLLKRSLLFGVEKTAAECGCRSG